MNASQAEWTAIDSPAQADPNSWTTASKAVSSIVERLGKIRHSEIDGTLKQFNAELADLGETATRIPTAADPEQQNADVRAYHAQLTRVKQRRDEAFATCK